MEYIDRAQRYSEWISGVSVYSTGRESPMDPRAPASKALMLLQEANLRLSEYITNLHHSNMKTVYLVDMLYQQYRKGEVEYYQKEIRKDNEVKLEDVEISDKILLGNYRYIPHLSRITINKELERERNMQVLAMIKADPLIWSNPEAQRLAWEILLRSIGDEWEKNIDVFLPKQPAGAPIMPLGAPPATPPGVNLKEQGISQILPEPEMQGPEKLEKIIPKEAIATE